MRETNAFRHHGPLHPDIRSHRAGPLRLGHRRPRAPWCGKRSDYFVLRHLAPDGRKLGEFLRRSSFDRIAEPAENVTSLPGVRVANSRLGVLLTYAGRRAAVWAELDLSGKELGRWAVPAGGYPAAFTGEAVYMQQQDGIVTLGRRAGRWIAIPLRFEGTLVGIDGNALVFADRMKPVLHRVPLPGN